MGRQARSHVGLLAGRAVMAIGHTAWTAALAKQQSVSACELWGKITGYPSTSCSYAWLAGLRCCGSRAGKAYPRLHNPAMHGGYCGSIHGCTLPTLI